MTKKVSVISLRFSLFNFFKAFRISTGKYFPLSSPDPLDGSEIRISLYFCEVHNCTPEPVFDNALWGSIYDNFSADGM